MDAWVWIVSVVAAIALLVTMAHLRWRELA